MRVTIGTTSAAALTLMTGTSIQAIHGMPIGLTPQEASLIIKENVATYQTNIGRDLCEKYQCCTITSTESCDLNEMTVDQSILVLPGGETRCIFSYSTPYAFQVIPGVKDKVLFYFQGGGACWDETSTNAGFCTTDSNPASLNGVFDRENELNAFRDFTIVHVLYCGGDIHGGNVVRSYTDKDGVPVTQRGFKNAEATLDWIVEQQSNGNLASTLSELVVMGCSAGSIGAQLWGNQAVKRIKWDKAAVIPDSYAGVFPDGSQGPLIYEYGMCSVADGFISPANQQKCWDQTLTLQDINAEFIADTPSVPYGFIQSKTDIVQESFYSAVAFSMNMSAAITPEEFYSDVNTIFEGYNNYPNFLTYLVDGNQHCFTPASLYFTADAISSTDNGQSSSQEMMHEWAGNFPLSNGESETTVCEGQLQLTANAGAPNDQTYCSDNLVPKKFTENY